jgi:hypothetical protein
MIPAKRMVSVGAVEITLGETSGLEPDLRESCSARQKLCVDAMLSTSSCDQMTVLRSMVVRFANTEL